MATGKQYGRWINTKTIRQAFQRGDSDKTEKTVWETWFFGATSSGATELLQADVTATSTVFGELIHTGDHNLTADVAGESVVFGNINHTGDHDLQAVVNGLSTVFGNLLDSAGPVVTGRNYRVYKKIQGARWR